MCIINELHQPAVSPDKTESQLLATNGLPLLWSPNTHRVLGPSKGRNSLIKQGNFASDPNTCTCMRFLDASKRLLLVFPGLPIKYLIAKFSGSSVYSIDVIKGQPQGAAVSFPAQLPAPVFTDPLAPHGPHTVSRSFSPCQQIYWINNYVSGSIPCLGEPATKTQTPLKSCSLCFVGNPSPTTASVNSLVTLSPLRVCLFV